MTDKEELAQWRALGDLAHIRELVEAEKAGRVVVLPVDDSEDCALYAIYQGEGIIGNCAGDPECALALLSFLACYVAEMMGTTHQRLLAEMARRPSIVERAEAVLEKEKGETGNG